MPTPNEQIREKIDVTWTDLMTAIDGLDDHALTAPGVTGTWSVKDILGHVTTWEDSTMNLSQADITGEPAAKSETGGEPWDMETFNANESAAKADLPLTEIFRLLNETHGRLLEWLSTIPEEHLATGSDVEERLRQDTWDHYPAHIEAITTWRASRS